MSAKAPLPALTRLRFALRWIFRGDDLYETYNTTQVFSDSCPHGIHCLLSPWHLKGHALPESVLIGLRLLRHLGVGVERPVRKPKPRHQVAELIAKLPPDQRIKHWKRFHAAGVI
jgi:hypothetical protein